MNCPANPGAWELHGAFHKKLRKERKRNEDGGVVQQRDREAAEEQARLAAQSGDEYDELLTEGTRYASEQDWRRAAKAYREAIALKPDRPVAYYNLGSALGNSGHHVESAQRLLEATERYPVGSELWAKATAWAFDKLRLKVCAEVAKPEWWNDEGLKALSARVVTAAPNAKFPAAHSMRATVLIGQCAAWEAGPRSAAELNEAATHYERAAVLTNAPAVKAHKADLAAWCRAHAESL